VKYRVTHVTEYVYGELVPLCHNVVRLRPRDVEADSGRASQRCKKHELLIDPAPAVKRERIDFFGNHVTWVALQEPHQRLKIRATSDVETTPQLGAANLKNPSWNDVAALLASSRDPETLAALEYTFDSPHVPRDPRLADYARPSFPDGAPIIPCLVDFTNRIYKEFTFDSSATTISTPILDVLVHRRGVCQDFAHLAIGCLRSLGLAARYVSGYVATKPPPGRPRLAGADASHAWLAAYIPSYGWLDFDPTNGLLPSGDHITLGFARDYDDLSPVKGVMIGGDRHSLRYSVDVEPVV
jgi:transglutaminase-like putative cysteine protease